MRQTIAAMNDLDQAVTTVGGIALRYGSFYGDPIDPLVTAVRARKWPIVGDGGGVWSYIHLEDAATSWLSRLPLVVAAKVIVATTVSSSSARSPQRPRLA